MLSNVPFLALSAPPKFEDTLANFWVSLDFFRAMAAFFSFFLKYG
jgi:hypothetical protein